MVKITANYRWKDGATFDHAYYQSEHMRITREMLTPLGLVRLEGDRVFTKGAPKPGHIVATSSAYFPSMQHAQAAMTQAAAALNADIPNYTNIQPEMHLCEVMSHYPVEQ